MSISSSSSARAGDTRAAILVRLGIAVVLALVLGVVSALWLPQGTALVTIPWGLAALLLGASMRRARPALLVGGVFGFVAAYSYLWADDRALPSGVRLLQLALVIVLPAAFGFCCGAAAAWVGGLAARPIRRRLGRPAPVTADPRTD
ncbi:hypothetical protein [Microbacterium capsulatum]|uniref:Uncharacterized protein n=1 Tax=Microbacterium capsulatum TaxID=3041921 RepID=A0ABU0XIS4_9MICO|nr:hypothetical protein [Microbacterium sp. ASV81]MDQ4215027.1 hypothetical protein [Microbacterium sp. ASV81]